MYTQTQPNAAAYIEANPSRSIWDNGGTGWDLNGNAYVSLWDTDKVSFAERVGNAAVWNKQ